MSKSVTVHFEDGSSHVYDDVPDNVDDSEVHSRASQEFGKPVAHMGTQSMAQSTQQAQQPSMGEKVIAAAQVPFQMAAEHPGIAAGAAGLYKANKLANAYLDKVKLETEAAKFGEQGIRAREAAQAAQASRMGASTITPSYGQAMNRPSVVQQGMEYASKIRQLAMDKVMQGARGATSMAPSAGVMGPAVGILAGGGAATGFAGNQIANMSPEQRKSFYDNQMLGAMGGDTSLSAAIMNRGQ